MALEAMHSLARRVRRLVRRRVRRLVSDPPATPGASSAKRAEAHSPAPVANAEAAGVAGLVASRARVFSKA